MRVDVEGVSRRTSAREGGVGVGQWKKDSMYCMKEWW